MFDLSANKNITFGGKEFLRFSLCLAQTLENDKITQTKSNESEIERES